MTKKVTKDTIKKLIEEVLNERDYKQSVTSITNKTNVGRNSAKAVADLADDGEEKLTPADFDVVLNDPSRLSADTRLQTAVTSFSEIDPDKDKKGNKLTGKSKEEFPQIKADAESALEKLATAQSYKGPSSIVMPSLTSAGGDAGVFSQSQMAIFGKFFETSSTFVERMKKLSDFSLDLYNASQNDQTNLTTVDNEKQLLTAIMVLDSLNFIVKDFESGSSAYLFEAFLAMMGGGKILGKELTDAGKMGGADFDYVQNKKTFKGSSKYYGKAGTLSQAGDGFDVDEPVLYTVALKKDAAITTGVGGGGTSDPTKIVKLAIYSFSVSKNSDGTFKFADKDGNVMTGLENTAVETSGDLAGKIKISGTDRGFNSSNYVGDLILCSSNTSSFKEMLSSAMENQNAALKDAYTSFEAFFKEVNESKEFAQTYLASGNHQDGIEALESIDSSEGALETMLNSIKGITKIEFTGVAGSRSYKKLPEQKITANFLKKLIQEKFKK